jgi:hypothetical protein
LPDIKENDEVIMPSYTFVSTANAFVLRGAKVAFFDISPDTMNIDETKIEQAITDKTKVIVPKHYAGLEELLLEFKEKNTTLEIIVGISKQLFFNNLGKVIFGKSDAHDLTVLSPRAELAILLKYMRVIEHKSVWLLAEVYKLRFKQAVT